MLGAEVVLLCPFLLLAPPPPPPPPLPAPLFRPRPRPFSLSLLFVSSCWSLFPFRSEIRNKKETLIMQSSRDDSFQMKWWWVMFCWIGNVKRIHSRWLAALQTPMQRKEILYVYLVPRLCPCCCRICIFSHVQRKYSQEANKSLCGTDSDCHQVSQHNSCYDTQTFFLKAK